MDEKIMWILPIIIIFVSFITVLIGGVVIVVLLFREQNQYKKLAEKFNLTYSPSNSPLFTFIKKGDVYKRNILAGKINGHEIEYYELWHGIGFFKSGASKYIYRSDQSGKMEFVRCVMTVDDHEESLPTNLMQTSNLELLEKNLSSYSNNNRLLYPTLGTCTCVVFIVG